MSDTATSPRPQHLNLRLEPGRLAVCRQEPDRPLPAWLSRASFFCVAKTSEELSLVVPEQWVGRDWQAERGFRALGVVGPLDFTWVGILADLTVVLRDAGVSVFVISTFDTDYVLVKEDKLESACQALENAGHTIEI